jgi:hypothetical protein
MAKVTGISSKSFHPKLILLISKLSAEKTCKK